MQHSSIAIIDIGSNSVRLVIYRQQGSIWQKVVNEKCQCRLGEGVARSRLIQPERMAVALDAIQRFGTLIEFVQPSQTIVIATSAVRDADNGPDFVHECSKILNTDLQVLSGEMEALHAAKGVAWSVPNATGIVADLGGSSLEITSVGLTKKPGAISMPIGPLQLLDLFGNNRKQAKAYIDNSIRQTIDTLDQQLNGTLVGQKLYCVGGAWRALAQLHMRDVNHPIEIVHRYAPSTSIVNKYLRPISHMDQSEAMQLNVAQPDRRLTLPYASLLLRRLIKWTKTTGIEFCSAGIREGALSLNIQNDHRQVEDQQYWQAVTSLVPNGGRFGPIGDTVEAWVRTAYEADIGGLAILPYARLREACALADLGWDEHPSHKKTATYLHVLHSAVLPHSHHERAQLAAIQFYRHKGRGADLNALALGKLLCPTQQQATKVLGRLIHLAMQICRSQAPLLAQTSLRIDGDKLHILVPKNWPSLQASSIQTSMTLLADACQMPVRLLATEESPVSHNSA